jgi:serine/threonine-protein kinase
VRVRLSARATPTTAHLLLDGKDLPSNPYQGVLAGDAVAHELLCEASGYVSQRVAVSLDRDVNVAIALERERHGAPRSQGTSGRGASAAGAASSAPAAPAAVAPNCAQPYYFDGQGIKKIRSECL